MPPDSLTDEVLDGLIRRAARRCIPLNVSFGVASGCNLSCQHCYLDGTVGPPLPLARQVRMLDELRDLGTLSLSLTGGEPLLNTDLASLIREARRRRLLVGLTTNGTLLTPARATELRRSGLRDCSISLYSQDPTIHDRITRTPGSWNATMHGIEAATEAGLQVVLTCAVMTTNLSSIAETRALAETLDLPVRFDVSLAPPRRGRSSSAASLQIGRDGIERVLDCLSEKATLPTCGSSATADRSQHAPCIGGWSLCAITADGKVYPCTLWPEPVGDLQDSTLAEIWRSAPGLRQLRHLTRADYLDCGDCPHRSACPLCPALSLAETGSPSGRSQVRCALGQAQARRDPQHRRGR